MKNWEEAYNNFDKARLDELKQKIDDKKCAQEEMKEFKKLNKIHDNLPKVKNLMDYKKRMQGKLKELKDLQSRYEEKDKYEKQKNKLEEEIKKYSERQEEIAKRQKEIRVKLEDKELNAEDRKDLEAEQEKLSNEATELRKKVDLNNEFFVQNEQNIKKDEDSLRKKINKKQLDKQIFETSSKISKCNFIAGRLLEGYDLESDFIKEKLTKKWQDKRFTSKEPIPGTKVSQEKENKEYEPIWSSSKLKKEAEKETEKENEKTELPAKKQTFEEAFPRLSKILPKFIRDSKLGKTMLEAKQKREQGEIKESTPTPIPKPTPKPQPVEKPQKTELDSFREGLKVDYDELLEIANKGEETIRIEKLDKLKEEAIKREEANKGKSQRQKLAETEASVDREAYIKRLENDGR